MITCFFEDLGKASLRHVAIDSLVEKAGKLLLIKRARNLSTEPGKWALPGGFLDRDENAPEGALRELLEETGWTGKTQTLFMIISRPKRPGEKNRQNVNFTFLIEPLKQIKRPDHEVSEIKWWPIEELKKIDLAFDHEEIIKLYLQYRQKPFDLPVLI